MGIVDIHILGYYNVTKSLMFFDQRGNTRIPPPPYRVPKLHPCNYYKTCQPEEMNDQVSKVQSHKETEIDLYPWLDSDDPRRDMMDEEILDKYIALSRSDLNTEERSTLMSIIKLHK